MKLNNELGEILYLITGVPQGDILSPILFVLMMNDYPIPTWEGSKRNFVMEYADDFTQVIVTKCTRINDRARNEHSENVK